MRFRRAAVTAAFAAAALLSTGCASWFVAKPRALRDFWNVQPALDAAGANRAELVRFLDHCDGLRDGDAARAAVFLVENMPGRGHVVFGRKDAKGADVDFDPLRYAGFAEAQAALDRIEKERGTVEDVRARFVPDVETVSAEFLVRHVDRSLATWRALPDAERPSFETFLDFVLPYRGSDEPLEDWLTPLQARLGELRAALPPGASREDLWKAFQQDLARRARFDEIYYLHPTDQSFSEITKSGMGRCEDLSNLQTFYARAFGKATACDYTPAWGHRDNNHAWTVDLDAKGRGRDPVGAQAAKVYRKTFARHPGLRDALPPGREPPNRWLANACTVDVTEQYGNSADVEIAADAAAAGDETVAYLCVFNGGEWVAVGWSGLSPPHGFDGPDGPGRAGDVGGVNARGAATSSGGTPGRGRRNAVFPAVGRGLLYLPVVHDGTKTTPIAAPFVVLADGSVRRLTGGWRDSVLTEHPSRVVVAASLVATTPEQRSADTGATTPVSRLTSGASYTLFEWDGAWKPVETFTAGTSARPADRFSPDALYWLVEDGSRRLERPFTVGEDGRQRFW